jgi:protein involved in polysaccharide export with SLBB domain
MLRHRITSPNLIMRVLVGAALLLALLPGPGPAAAQSAPELRPGDVVRVTVWRQPEMSGEFAVAADSTLAHPLYGQVVVAGVPLSEAESRVRELLGRYESNPQFVLEPLFRVAVGGEVRQPNLYTLAPSITVAEAVALAGGPTERGRLERVTLVRDGGERMLDLTDPGSAATQLRIRSGDRIVVARRTSVFREYVVPVASVTGAIATIVNLLLR